MPGSVASSEAEDVEASVDSGIIPIEDLANHQINASDIIKLKGAHIHTIGQLMGTMKKNLTNIKGFSDIKVEKLKDTASKCTPRPRFLTGTELLEKRKTCFKIGTGSEQLNRILGGGFESRSVSEVYGEFRCGKTQLCLTMAVIAQRSIAEGGAAGKVAIIDTEGTFRPERIIQIAGRFNIDPEQANENLLVIRATNSEDQQDSLGLLAEEFATGHYRLLIVDSILNLFRTDYVGRGQLSERQQQLGLHLRRLVDFAEEFNIAGMPIHPSTRRIISLTIPHFAVFMTNHVQSDPGASALFSGADGRKPTGGHVMAHASTTRLLLRKGRGEERVAKLMDSPDCPEAEATYVITEGGINDPDKA